MKRNRILISAFALLLPAVSQGQQPAFHGNAQRTGFSPVAGPARVALKWKLNLGDAAIISSPVVGPDGTIYLGSVLDDKKNPQHWITAVLPNGVVKWRFRTAYRDTQTMSSPAIGPDGKVYVGAQDCRFYALNADGTLAWQVPAESPVQQHPVVAQDGSVYVGIDGKLMAFTSSGTLRWSANLGIALFGGPSLSPDEQTIYAFSYNLTGPVYSTVFAFNRDGSLKWRSDGAYAYTVNAPLTVRADGIILVPRESVTALNPADGTVRWSFAPAGASYGPVAANPAGEVVFAFDRFLGKLSANGALLWQNEFWGGVYSNEGEASHSAPLVDVNGNVFLGLGTGKRFTRDWGKVIRAYSPAGALLWEFRLTEGVYTSSPAIGPDGTLYIGDMGGNLYAFGTADASLAALSLDPDFVTGGGTSTGTVRLTNAPSGDISVTLSTSSHFASVPTHVIVPAGATQASFPVTTVPMVTMVTVSAVCNGVTKSALLTIGSPAPPALQSLSVNPATVNGGNPSTGMAVLTAPAPPGGTVVALASSKVSVAQVPASVTVPFGATSASFQITTSPTRKRSTAVTISGTLGSTTRSATLTVTRS